MKNAIVFISVAAFLMTSACSPKIDIDAEKMNAKTVVDQFAQSFQTEDMELFSKIMAHDADMVNFGTDATERFVGWDALKESMTKQFAAFDDVEFVVKDQVIKLSDSGKTAWFSEVIDWNLVVQGQPARLEGIRFTGVLNKRNNNWVIVQFHASVPVAGQAAEY